MLPKRLLTVAALFAAALFILDVPAAMATDHNWQGDVSSDWNVGGNWDQGTVPGPNDEAIIGDVTNPSYHDPVVPATPTNAVGAIKIEDGGLLMVDTSSSGTQAVLTVDPGTETGKLIIESGGKLTIGEDGTVWLDDAVTHEIGGTIELTDQDSILHFDDTATVGEHSSVSGTIDGQDDDAQIAIANGKTLTNEITIQGALVVDDAVAASATFANHGLVHANRTSAPWVLDVATATITDTSGNRWQASANANATLRFSNCAALSGNITVSNGVLDIDANVCTTGTLDFSGGKIEIADGCWLKINQASCSCP